MKTVFYIDPQSGNNLAMYDYELLSRIKDINLIYIGNVDYNYKDLSNCRNKLIFSYSRHASKYLKLLSYLKTLFVLIFYFFKYRPDVIHIQWVRVPRLEYCYYKLMKVFFHLKIVYTVHNILPHVCTKGDGAVYGNIYCKLADILIVHTERSKDELSEKFDIKPDRIAVAPHGPLEYAFDGDEIQKEILRLKSEYNLKGRIIVSILGYQSSYKGTDILIDAWLKSPELSSSEKVSLVVAGKFRDIPVPENLCGNIVCIPRKLTDLEFNAFLKMTDLLVLPYRRIEQSGLLMSAFSEHIPYCATDVGELLAPLKIANIGWKIEDNSPSGVAGLIISILKDQAGLKELKSKNSEWNRIRHYYDWNRSSEITENCYKGLQKVSGVRI